MNSYPAELLVQLVPVMFVAGLDPSRRAASPPPAGGEGTASTSPPTPKRVNSSDPFALLSYRLREAFGSQRKPAIWTFEDARKSKSFQMVLVDKAVQFPPRKIPPSSDLSSSQTLHSPLSPLTPSSPLYPDGLIAPIWIRKHTALVPSVFVLFLRLFEYNGPSITPRSPLEPDGPDVQRQQEEREKEERKHDAELAREIAERKKSTNERGMKLTVVLMASRKMLDDPTLDGRLTFIRRSSGLDSRAALFVLSPVSPAELADFIKSLQEALYEPALEYYTAHSKRVRRKRNRHAQANSGIVYPQGGGLGANASARPLPLRPEGWTVRYEYKMACFAEFRGEDEVALKHFQDAYSTMMIMFGSPAILPPRTKRWAEAKVLADCINVKICKLYLYNSEHALALSQLNAHLRRFSDLSARVWGIGEETFEYWSWLAKQYRVFAELLELGTHAVLIIPVHLPPPTSLPPTVPAQPQQEADAFRALGLNPSTALMHPGFYYYVAASCTERRRERFMEALENEPSQGAAPGYQNEKKVDHLASILELYTKSYELFKKYAPAPASDPSQVQGRFTLWIAYRIAQSYYAYGKYDMAIKFFERIAKTYRRERWSAMLSALLSTWYACAQQLGDVEMSMRLLIERLAVGSKIGKTSVEEELLAMLKSSMPSVKDALVIADLTEIEPILNSSVVFWVPEIEVGEHVAFQIVLSVPSEVSLSMLPISALRIYHTDDCQPIIIEHKDAGEGGVARLSRIEVGDVGAQARGEDMPSVASGMLRWKTDSELVVSGRMSSTLQRKIKFTRAVLVVTEGKWTIELPFELNFSRNASTSCPKWFISISPPRSIPIRRSDVSSVIIKHRPHDIRVTISHQPPAYLGEQYPITINITNNDDRELNVSLDVLQHPGEDGSVNQILLEGQHSSSLMKGILFGNLTPGVTACKTLRLASSGAPGERMLDVSVQSRKVVSTAVTSDSSEEGPRSSSDEVEEFLQTLIIPAVAPFAISHDVTYKRCSSTVPGPCNLDTYSSDYWNDSVGGNAIISTILESIDCAGASNVLIEAVKLTTEGNEYSKVKQCSLDADEFPSEFMPGDQLSIVCELSLSPPEDYYTDNDAALPKPGQYEVSWRRVTPNIESALSTTRISLPPLHPPSEGLIALLHVLPMAYLHQPFRLELVLRNLHPTRTARPTVSLELEPSESFVVAGIRSGRLPTLIPGAEEKIIWKLIPLECGPSVPLPRIKVLDRRKADENPESPSGPAADAEFSGDEVPIIDVRWDFRRSEKDSLRPRVDLALDGEKARQHGLDQRFTIVVSPS